MMTVDFRLFYVSDGASVAEYIYRRFTSARYNMVVEKYNLTRRSSSLSSSSSPSHGSNTSLKADMSVFLVTPVMMDYLYQTDNGGFTHILDPGNKPVVALCFHVPMANVKFMTTELFCDPFIQWRYLEVGTTGETFHHCMIGLYSLLDHLQEPMPMPTLKKCHLLPTSPVMAGDTIYILLESSVVHTDESYPFLMVSADNFCQKAEKVGDRLYEFLAPECSGSKLSIEISSKDNQKFGSEEIIYKDKRELLASILKDIVNPIEFMTEALQINETSPEVLDSKLAEWFGFREDQTHQTEIQRLTAQWMNSLTFNEGMSGQELPTLLHLAAKYNFAILTQTLLMQPWASMALQIKNKDGLTPYRLALKYQHEALLQYLVEGFEAEQSSPEFVEDINMKPEYCSPDGEILLDIIPRQHFVLNINLDSSQMFTSIPEEDNSLLEQNVKVQRSPTRKRMEEDSGYMNMTPPPRSRFLQRSFSTQPNAERLITPDSDKKSIIHGRQYSLDSSGVNQRSPGQNVTSPPNLPHRGVLDRSSPTSTRLSGGSSGGRPPTPPRQAQMLTVFGHPDQQVKIMNQPDMQKQNAQSKFSKHTYSSNKGNKMEPGKLRRSSMTASQYIMPTPSLLKSSQSMSRINEVSLAEEFIAPVSKAKASPEDGQPSNKHQVLSGTPKPCYPVSTVPPPLPVTLPPPFTSIAPPKSRFNMAPANNDAPPPLPEKAPRLPVKLHTVHRQAGLKRFIMGKNGVISPDFSQPIEVYFADPLARKDFSNEYITPKTDDLNESIYEEVDTKPSAEMPSKDVEDGHMLRASCSKGRNSFRRRILLDNESTLEALKQLQSELARMEPSPSTQADSSQAASPPSPLSSTPSPKEEQTKSPSIFSSLTSKFSRSRTKQYRSSKDHVTKM